MTIKNKPEIRNFVETFLAWKPGDSDFTTDERYRGLREDLERFAEMYDAADTDELTF